VRLAVFLLHFDLDKITILDVVQVPHLTMHISKSQQGEFKVLLGDLLENSTFVVNLIFRLVDVVVES
jgi:hypothetical protein